MSNAVIALASDHAGLTLKASLVEEVKRLGYDVVDLGAHSGDSVDYPDYGYRIAAALAEGKATIGVAVCGSGIGISMAANRYPCVRAALCHDVTSARLSREHNDANVLALGVRVIGPEVALDCLDAFFATEFSGGERNVRRIGKLG